MPKYIDADALLAQMKDRRFYVGRRSDPVCIIEDAPAADVEPKRKWISVNPDNPKEDGKYFVLRHSQGRPIVEIMYYGIPEYLKDRHFYFYDSEWGDVVVGDVTHWLPLSALPELPKEEYDGTCRTE